MCFLIDKETSQRWKLNWSEHHPWPETLRLYVKVLSCEKKNLKNGRNRVNSSWSVLDRNNENMCRAVTLTTLILICQLRSSCLEMISKEDSKNRISRPERSTTSSPISKLDISSGFSRLDLESQVSFVSHDPEAERRLRDRWNAFVAETTKELDFDLKVFLEREKKNEAVFNIYKTGFLYNERTLCSFYWVVCKEKR